MMVLSEYTENPNDSLQGGRNSEVLHLFPAAKLTDANSKCLRVSPTQTPTHSQCMIKDASKKITQKKKRVENETSVNNNTVRVICVGGKVAHTSFVRNV